MILTKELANNRAYKGIKFYAKKDRFGVNPVGYANQKQAANRVNKLAQEGVDATVTQLGRVFYVEIKN